MKLPLLVRWSLFGLVLVAVLVITACDSPAEPDASATLESGSSSGATVSAEDLVADPADWDARFVDLVTFVQQARQREFRVIPDIVYMDPPALSLYLSAGNTIADFVDAEMAAGYEQLDDLYRATGVTNEEFDLFSDTRSGVGTAAVAVYEPGRHRLVLPQAMEAGALSPFEQVVLVHELAHALQGTSTLNRIHSTGIDNALAAALIEGEASWVERQYFDTMTPEDQHDARMQDSEWDDSVPGPIQAEFDQAYVLGYGFFHGRFTVGGPQAVEEGFNARSASWGSILDPWTFTGENTDDGFPSPDRPARPPAVDSLLLPGFRMPNEFVFSAPRWLQIFSVLMPGDEALRAARAIPGVAAPRAWLDDDRRACFVVDALPNADGAELVEDALAQWADAFPELRSVTGQDEGFRVMGCEPDAAELAAPRVSALNTVYRAGLTVEAEVWAFERNLPTDTGFCVAWHFFAEPGDDAEAGQEALREFLRTADTADVPAGC